MISLTPAGDELAHQLARELQSLPEESAEALAAILKGIFACMRDLNDRVAALEEARPLSSEILVWGEAAA